MRFEESDAVGDEGVAAVYMLFSRGLRCIFQEVSKRDVCADAQVEVCRPLSTDRANVFYRENLRALVRSRRRTAASRQQRTQKPVACEAKFRPPISTKRRRPGHSSVVRDWVPRRDRSRILGEKGHGP